MDQPIVRADDDPSETIIAMKRAALDRWGQGDPSGFLEVSAPDVVYFDPSLERRIDGRAALTRYHEAPRGKVSISRYDLINPRVQRVGDAAMLTFNYVSYCGTEDAYLWNCTEVYRRSGDRWEIIQTHWSYTKAVRAYASTSTAPAVPGPSALMRPPRQSHALPPPPSPTGRWSPAQTRSTLSFCGRGRDPTTSLPSPPRVLAPAAPAS